jgi:hypothetical protein
MKLVAVSLLVGTLLSAASIAASQIEITPGWYQPAAASQDQPCPAEDLCAPPDSTPAASLGSGIEGRVFIGPTCPVVRSDRDCADRPFQTSITVLNPDGSFVTRFQTDEQGRFRVELSAADYVVHPESPGALPRAQDQPVRVTEGQYTRVEIHYDSGIR